uniref:SJCHGC09341 protein n=1 Tax=Schistosoma japonicum TaxID=6182 RepID=Q5DGZ2_SCHJA|nr:SJCHGC09341 protein [Schistosoma japonicum]
MDYVLHDDIIPYIPQDNSPIKNEYLSEFLLSTPDKEPPFIPTDHLRRWIETRKRSLEVTSIHREVTEGIRVTVLPFYMGRRTTADEKGNDIRYWRYLIRLESLNMERVQLRERFWKVFSVTGNLESNRGKGVVGMQPILSPECPVFQYHSHIQVPVPWAHMWGSFRFEKLNGGSLDVKIPSFPLYDRTYWSNSNDKLG